MKRILDQSTPSTPSGPPPLSPKGFMNAELTTEMGEIREVSHSVTVHETHAHI